VQFFSNQRGSASPGRTQPTISLKPQTEGPDPEVRRLPASIMGQPGEKAQAEEKA
jgi:hypothetical protein